MAHILIVDDDLDLLDVYTALLELQGHRVTAVSSGNATFGVVQSDAPDLVLLDMGLPDLHGLEVHRQLQAIAPEVPVLVLTGTEALIPDLKAAGIEFRIKPVAKEELISLVAKLTPSPE